ncbi:L,D-transpeptidase family protein [Mucilaginibacter sp. PPCGB 2223]|uniref:L,D-transpeptidase family protein n=1 Tax=Mucilaginibacter sp. PPCGB 2223 TaxID=1886027 RepID=UPI001586B58A|nr:L,D-transpeptidase family protein [Mucilaginibacter sp. PPCGB 2223]
MLIALWMPAAKRDLPDSKLASDVRENVWPRMQKELTGRHFVLASPMYIRIIKDEGLLEVWLKHGSRYHLYKSYEICFFSGGLGTKTRSGDGKSPEGFYTITPAQLNPASNYYLAVNIGYPNKLEIIKGYTGDAIMIHGHCASIGCYAMTNPRIEEIYTLMYKAFEAGQEKIDVDIFPFRMTAKKFAAYARLPYQKFWRTLKPGYDLFEKYHVPPVAGIKNKEYWFSGVQHVN